MTDATSTLTEEPSRKRDLETFLADQGETDSSLPMHGLVVSSTGLPLEEKQHLQSIVEELGGRLTADLNIHNNTHLLAVEERGEKYNLASTTPHIHIVRPEWVSQCKKANSLVEESNFVLGKEVPESCLGKLQERIKSVDASADSSSRLLFGSVQAMLLGFEDDSESETTLSKAIRSRGGTIFWDVTPFVTHLIVHDLCNTDMRNAARIVSVHHTKMPPCVSPRWVLESIKDNRLLPPESFPDLKLRKESALMPQKVATAVTKSNPRSLRRQSSITSALFSGSMFYCLRVAPPPAAMDYAQPTLEALVHAHGGRMVTARMVRLLQLDAANKARNHRHGGTEQQQQRRQCFVLCWGGVVPQHWQVNPMLADLDRNPLVRVICVTPIWLYTCIATNKLVRPEKLPVLLSPQPWPMMRLAGGPHKAQNERNNMKLAPAGKEIRVSVTGIDGTARLALVQALQSAGLPFDDSMTRATTHLICKEAGSSEKYKKALEWGLFVVTVDWLFHVLRYGWAGKAHTAGGCESLFPVQHKT